MTAAVGSSVCDACARRTWLLGRLAGHLEIARSRIADLLAIGDDDLIAAVAGARRDAVRRELAGFDPRAEAAVRRAAGVEAVCRCDPGYPEGLRDLAGPPAVLHVAGGLRRLGALTGAGPVAIVGTRRPSAYGREVARSLAGDCARAGVTVVSGLALGVDARAHDGALGALGTTIAVMPGGADLAYPAAHRRLHARVRERGLAVSELGPGVASRRWMFPARNRIIAALSAMTVVVQARDGSGALLTAEWARSLGRVVGAVPGQVTQELSAGPHDLLRGGARPVTGARDVLDALGGASLSERPPTLGPPLDGLLRALAAGDDLPAAFAEAGLDAAGGLAAMASLELSGHVRRTAGGGLEVSRWGRPG